MTHTSDNSNKDYKHSKKPVNKVKENSTDYPNNKDIASDFVIPEGYVSGDEFEKRVIAGLKRKLEENGYL